MQLFHAAAQSLQSFLRLVGQKLVAVNLINARLGLLTHWTFYRTVNFVLPGLNLAFLLDSLLLAGEVIAQVWVHESIVWLVVVNHDIFRALIDLQRALRNHILPNEVLLVLRLPQREALTLR